jgi:hypothetical protein
MDTELTIQDFLVQKGVCGNCHIVATFDRHIAIFAPQ